MKKLLFFSVLLLGATLIPQNLRAQSTEGDNFWVTFLQGDKDDDGGETDSGGIRRFRLSLIMSARETTNVHIENTFFNFKIDTVVNANKHLEIFIFDGTNPDRAIRSDKDDYSSTSRATNSAQYCYTYHPEMIDSCVLHVYTDDKKPISLYASNYKAATFDATNVLPKDALQSEYLIQCYTPSDHQGSGKSQGSHFAIVAVEDNTVAQYILTAPTYNGNHQKGDTVTTPVLKAGQVWYVWSGPGSSYGFGHSADLSGTKVKAYDATNAQKAKPIAIFQGNPHTNIPFYQDLPSPPSKPIGERDHIFSQAMPLSTWGTTFALTTSEKRDRDVIRVMAIDDHTELYLNGDKANPIHVFDFSQDDKQYWEFEIGVKDVPNGRTATYGNFFEGSSFFLESSCPVSVHSFIVSKKYGKTNTSDGDPAMLWVNPIEQRIDQITFATYQSKLSSSTKHYTNVITTADNVSSMTLDGKTTTLDGTQSLASQFYDVAGSKGQYKYAKLNLGTTAGSHTLKCDPKKGFIAHVYGLTSNESYGYNAGGAAKPLNADVTINGDTLVAGKTTQICRRTLGSNEIKFTCTPDTDHAYTRITWDFGDGTPLIYGHKTTIESGPLPAGTTGTSIEELNHTYAKDSVYKASVKLERTGSTACSNIDTAQVFPMEVVLEALHITTMPVKDHLCSNTSSFRIYYETKEDLKKQNPDGSRKVDIQYTPEAKSAGFDENIDLDKFLKVDEENRTYFNIEMPTDTVLDGASYGIKFTYKTKCDTTDTIVPFTINYTSGSILAQRWENAIAVWTPEEMLRHIKDNDKTNNWKQKSIHFDGYAWFQRDTTGTSRDYTWMPTETESFLLRERVPENHEFYVDIYFSVYDSTTRTTSLDTISSCPIAFAKSAAPDMFEADSAIIELGDIVVYRADRNYMLVMSAQDGEAKWINSQGSTVASADVRAGGSLVPLPPENGLYILRVIVGKNKKNMKVMVY